MRHAGEGDTAAARQGSRETLALLWDGWMLLLALLSLGLIAWVELTGLHWPEPRFKRVAAVDAAIVALFLGEFLVRWRRAPDPRRFLRSNWYELLGLVPLYAEAFSWMRVWRLLRLVRVLRVLRMLKVLRRVRRVTAFAREVLVASQLAYTVSLSVVVVLTMAAGVWLLERGVNPALSRFPDALWWAIVTATTVGYGDITPQTGVGRALAGVLMVLGIGLIGVVASSLSAAVLAVGKREEAEASRAGPSLVEELERLAALHARGALSDAEFSRAKQRVLEASPSPGRAEE